MLMDQPTKKVKSACLQVVVTGMILTFLTETRTAQGSRTPVDAFALILQMNSNFAPHRTVWFCTSCLEKNRRKQLKIAYRWQIISINMIN